jgi:hypothetical protein
MCQLAWRSGCSAARGDIVGVESLSHDIAPHRGEMLEEGPRIIQTALHLCRQSKGAQRVTPQARLMTDD